eukprot:Plantae.Rhodophyta-Hildenbrandia_rubra.ctg1927.p1 GENE.Plantae.Rhodophyta-Hildenbrandia_rubra.ctg1927~~Plantae.Rhodophyta-Hildenbrandia_rubra.ctg1927.p1  ORF type:complete len:412 (-),score=78.33 Plantae.Rhodophyta-Hildenbrandia_rubra.ctg1927:5755-6990(-)
MRPLFQPCVTRLVAVASVAVTSFTLSPIPFDPIQADFSFSLNPFTWFSSRSESSLLSGKAGDLLVWGNGRKLPGKVDGLPSGIVHAAIASRWSAAVDEKGSVWIWGDDWKANRLDVQSVIAKRVAVSGDDVVVVDTKGKAWKGSVDEYGSVKNWLLMSGDLSGQTVEKLECSSDHCIAVTKNGLATSWGSNEFGKAGLVLASKAVDSPTTIGKEIGVTFVDVAAGDHHTVLLDKDGGVWTCGDDMWGQQGKSKEPWKNGSRSTRLGKAEIVSQLPVCEIEAGEGHTVLRVKDGGVVTFGFNQWGQLAHHNFATMAPAARIGGVDRAIGIAAGRLHTGIVDEHGHLRCVGGNEKAQLGNGSLQPTAILKRVKGISGKKSGKSISGVFFGGDASAVIVVPCGNADDAENAQLR